MFDGEKECFVSKSEEPEYYYLKEGDIIQKGDQFQTYIDKWEYVINSIGNKIGKSAIPNTFRRKIQKNTLPEDGC